MDSIWRGFIADRAEQEYLKSIKQFLKDEMEAGKTICPPFNDVFRAFNVCPFNKTKVVIIGYEPYSLPKIADGLAYSCNTYGQLELANIYKEVWKSTVYELDKIHRKKVNWSLFKPSKYFQKTDLDHWAEQGILLLNSILTVQEGKPESHKDIGWQQFTIDTIEFLSKSKQNLVFILWGSNVTKYEKYIQFPECHLIIKGEHPMHKTKWFEKKHFYKCNEYLKEHKKLEIQWLNFSQ